MPDLNTMFPILSPPDNPGSNPRPGMQLFGHLLQGYPGPWPGTPEFQAARAAGQHPIMDWLRANRPGTSFGGHPGGGGNPGIAIGEQNPTYEPPHIMPLGAPAPMAAAAPTGLAPLGGDERRRPIPLTTQRRPAPKVMR